MLALVAGAASQAVQPAAEQAAQFQINLFWVVVSAVNFVVFFLIIRAIFFPGITRTLEDRRLRIETGLRDAEQARRDRESGEQERLAALQEARREANDIINRAQKVASDSREADIAATREELARMRERAAADLESEKQRAIDEIRSQVTDLALAVAGRVVGDAMTGDRQRKIVADFLAEPANRSQH